MSRGRPKIYSNLVTTNIKLPLDMLEAAKAMNINISHECRDAISNAIGDERRIELHNRRKTVESHFKGVPTDVIKNLIETSRKWNKFLPRAIDNVNKEYGVNITPQDIEDIQETY